MAEGDIDLRGTQGAVVLPGGTVVQNYPQRDVEQLPMNPRNPDEVDSRLYDQGRELAEVKARLTAVEATAKTTEADVKTILALLQRPSFGVTINQLLVSILMAIIVVALVLGVSYVGQ